MAFKMKGSPMHKGTASHTSLRKASALKDGNHSEPDGHNHAMEGNETQAQANARMGGDTETPAPAAQASKTVKPADKKAYGGTKTWKEGQEASGGTLDDTTTSQREYEKKMKADNPDWNKREDNDWKKRQNKINKALGSSKVYDTTRDIATKTNDEGEKIMRGVGSNKDKTLTAAEKSAEKAAISTQKDVVAKARSAEGGTDKDTRDEAQMEIGEIRSGRDNEKTGTVASRTLAKGKVKFNEAQIALRAHREAVKAWKEGGKEGPRPKRK